MSWCTCVMCRECKSSVEHCREGFGYINPNWRDPPSTDAKYVRKRAMQLQITLQCGKHSWLCVTWSAAWKHRATLSCRSIWALYCGSEMERNLSTKWQLKPMLRLTAVWNRALNQLLWLPYCKCKFIYLCGIKSKRFPNFVHFHTGCELIKLHTTSN